MHRPVIRVNDHPGQGPVVIADPTALVGTQQESVLSPSGLDNGDPHLSQAVRLNRRSAPWPAGVDDKDC
jgi:hypothetical protein